MWVAVVGDINIASMLVDRAAIAVVCQHNAREMRIPLALAALLLYGISRFEPSASPTAKPPEDASLVSPMHHNVTDTSQFPMLRQLSSSAPPSAIPSPPPMPPPSAISSRPQMQVVVAEFYFDHAGELTYLTDAGQKATCDAVATGAAVAHGDIECIYFASESAHRLRHLLRATVSAHRLTHRAHICMCTSCAHLLHIISNAHAHAHTHFLHLRLTQAPGLPHTYPRPPTSYRPPMRMRAVLIIVVLSHYLSHGGSPACASSQAATPVSSHAHFQDSSHVHILTTHI